jgi:hypothetical protein
MSEAIAKGEYGFQAKGMMARHDLRRDNWSRKFGGIRVTIQWCCDEFYCRSHRNVQVK